MKEIYAIVLKDGEDTSRKVNAYKTEKMALSKLHTLSYIGPRTHKVVKYVIKEDD